MNELDKLVNDFKKLKTIDKKNIIIEEAKEQLAMIVKLNNYYKKSNVKLNRELIDLKKDYVSEDDYLEAAFAYINILNEYLGNIVDELPLK